MTYCVGVRNQHGLVFLADSRTNAGLDQISTFRKLHLFEIAGERVIVLLTAGNLAISQSIASHLRVMMNNPDEKSLATVPNMFSAAKLVGDTVRKVYARDAEGLKEFGIEFNVNLILGGQIKGEAPRLFNVYSAGNFIEATSETPYFQIGESKYGKPILDRVLNYSTPLNLATKCALISMDSTLKSNISVGLPLDLLVYEKDSLKADKLVTIDESNPYFQLIHELWGEKLREAFNSIAEPNWSGSKKSSAISSPAKKMGVISINRELRKTVPPKRK